MDTSQTIDERTRARDRFTTSSGVSTSDPGRARISWSAIFAGSALAAVISLTLYLIGLGIGGSTLDTTAPGDQLRSLAVPSGIWAGVSTIIALFVGGWCAARLSPSVLRTEGVLHGLVTWGFVTIATFWLIGSAVTSVLGGAAGLAQSALPAASQQAGPADRQRLQEQAGNAASEAQQRAPAAVGKAGSAVGKGSLAGAIGILTGGLAAAVGGAVGAGGRVRSVREVETAQRMRD